MKLAEQIKAETTELNDQIGKLIMDFEEKTGFYISHIQLVDFAYGQERFYKQPLDVQVVANVPPNHLKRWPA